MSEVVPTSSSAISEYTMRRHMKLWMDNLEANLYQARDGLDLNSLPHKKEPCIVVGAGPSLTYYNHLEMIKNSGWKHPVFSCDKMLADCLRHKIVPFATATVDGNPKLLGFYIAGVVQRNASNINAVFSVLIHPTIVKTWNDYKGKIFWFVPVLDDPNKPELTQALYYLTKEKSFMSGIGNVGACLWNIAYSLECDPIILVGIDFSEQIQDKADAVYFAAYTAQIMAKVKDGDRAQYEAADLHQLESNPDFIADKTGEGWLKNYYEKGKPVRYLVNPIWKFYRDKLAEHIVSSKRHTINATGNGCLHTEAKDAKGNYILKADNFEAMNLQDALEKYK